MILATSADQRRAAMYARVVRMDGVDPDALRGFGEIGLFETEEDLRTGDEVLRKMDAPIPGMPSPTWVESYEVAVERRS
jgi:hypothetical protein